MFGDLWGQKASARPTLRGKNVVHSLLQSFDLTRVAKRNEVASEISIGIFVFVTSSDLQVQLVSWNMSSLAHVMTTCGMLRMASCSLHYKATSPYIPRQGMNSRRVLSAEIMSYSKWTLLPSSSATWFLPCLKDQFPGVFNQIKFRREAKIMTVMLVLAMLNLDGSSFPSLRWWRSDWPCTFAINWDCDSSHPSQTCKNASEMQLQIFGIHFICHIVSIPVVSS